METAQTTLRDTISAAVDAVEETPVETQEVKGVPAETAEQLKKDETGRLHKSDGKFAQKVEPAPVTTPKPRPQSWKKDYDPHWNKLVTGQALTPEEAKALADYSEQREAEYAKGVSTYKTEWDRAKPILDAFNPYQQQLQQSGVRPEQLIQNMMMRHQALQDPNSKLQTWLQLGRDYGVPIQQVLQRLQPQVGQDGQPVPQDPRLGMMAQELNAIKAQIARANEAQQRQQQQEIAKQIESFSSNKEKYPHFETLRTTMADLLDKGLSTNMEEAYSLALRMPQHDDIRTAMEEEARKAKEAAQAREAAAKAQQARGRNIIPKSSTPGSAGGSSEGKKSLRETIAEAAEGHAGRI